LVPAIVYVSLLTCLATDVDYAHRRVWLRLLALYSHTTDNIETSPTMRYSFNAKVDARNMWETYMPAFEACVKEAKAEHVMCSYNALNGKLCPSSAEFDIKQTRGYKCLTAT
jgi:hypothetical protein